MTPSLEEIADRIIICGLSEMQRHLSTGEIGAVVTACKSRELEKFNDPSKESYNPKKDTGPELLAKIKKAHIPHHQSLLYQFLFCWHEALGLSKEEGAALSEEDVTERIDSFCLDAAKETMSFIDDFLTTDKDKKIMIHCAAGSDRSAMIAVAYMLTTQGINRNTDLAIRQLQRIRPWAALDAPSFVFERFLGEQYSAFDTATRICRNTVYSNALTPRKEGRIRDKEFRCLRHYFDAIAESSSQHRSRKVSGIERYLSHVSACNRFGINMQTWYHKHCAL